MISGSNRCIVLNLFLLNSHFRAYHTIPGYSNPLPSLFKVVHQSKYADFFIFLQIVFLRLEYVIFYGEHKYDHHLCVNIINKGEI